MGKRKKGGPCGAQEMTSSRKTLMIATTVLLLSAVTTGSAVASAASLSYINGGGNLAGLSPLDVGFTALSAPKLGALLRGRKVKFGFTVSAPCRGSAGILVKKDEVKRLKLGTKDTFIGVAVATDLPAAGGYPGTLTIAKKYRAKLRKAKRVTAFVVVACRANDGSTAVAWHKVVFKR